MFSKRIAIIATFLATSFGHAAANPIGEAVNDCWQTDDKQMRVIACQTVINTFPDISRNAHILLRAHNTLGLALCDVKRGAEAVPHFEWVLRHNSSIAGYFENYSRALRDAGRYDDSMRAVNQAIRMAPNYAFVYNGKAHTLEAMGNYDAAFRVLEKAFEIDSNNSGLFEYRGKLLGLMRRYDEALSDFTRAREIDPTNDHIFKTRGEMEIAQGKVSDGIADLRRYPTDGEEIEDVRQEIAEAVHSIDGDAPTPSAPLTVRPDATEQAQKAAAEAEERAKKAEAEAQAIRDLEAAKAREKAAVEAKAAAEKEQAEAQRAEDARMKAESEPVNVLSKGYAFYIATKRCHETRDGYATVWINDVEIEKAKSEIATVEKRLDPDRKIDRDAAWKFANGQVDKLAPVLDDKTCHEALAEVDALFKKVDPDAAMTHKDF